MNESTGFDRDGNLLRLLGLLPDGPDQWVSDRLDGNLNGRVFGGQLLGHAVAAALAGAQGRHLSSLRLNFLQGALGDRPLHWSLEPLQRGNRFTTCRLRATQGERSIADAQVSLQMPATGYQHAAAMPLGVPPPDQLPTMAEIEQRVARATGAPGDLQRRGFLELRLVDSERFLMQPADTPTIRYWLKARDRLPDDPSVHVAALAYLSDFWFNYAAIAPHLALVGARDRIYVASLNHALWSYAPCRADEWLLFDVTSPCAADGRGLAWGKIYSQDGRLVACASQETLCSPRQPAA